MIFARYQCKSIHCFNRYFISHVVGNIFHDLGLVMFIRGRSMSLWSHVLCVLACVSLNGCQNWEKVVVQLFLVACPPIFLNFPLRFRSYFEAIFYMFVGYDVSYIVLKYYAKITLLRVWIKSLSVLYAHCVVSMIYHALRLCSLLSLLSVY